VSRAAKGADCKSAGYAFAGSSPASPTTFENYLAEIILYFALIPAPFAQVRRNLFQVRKQNVHSSALFRADRPTPAISVNLSLGREAGCFLCAWVKEIPAVCWGLFGVLVAFGALYFVASCMTPFGKCNRYGF
jgi:hypothetical protein